MREIDTNVQSILGYVVRWIDHGIGCSTVPDLDDIGLMEDRATLRISSQLLSNWLKHGVCDRSEVESAIVRLARTVDQQNEGEPDYAPMSAQPAGNLALDAARALIFEGAEAASGYTERALHHFRALRKRERRTRK